MIPSANPHAAYLAQREDIDAAIRRVLDSGWYIHGQELLAFEKDFAGWVGTSHALGVANGTDAIEIALRACDIVSGDEVIAPAHTASATIAAIERTGAVPILVDIESQTFGLDPDKLAATVNERRHTGKLRAIVAVHLYGHPARIDEISKIAQESGLRLVEDCAQAHGASWKGHNVGTWGDAGAFSFYPTKNLGALGDGGAVTTSNSTIAERVRILREYGWRDRYCSSTSGVNSRLDEIQAAILRTKLATLDENNSRRQRIAQRYDLALKSSSAQAPVRLPEGQHVYHQYALLHPDRDAWRKDLKDYGIGAAILYPFAIHEQPAYAQRLPRGAGGLATSARVCREVMCLPIHPQLDDTEVEDVAAALVKLTQATAGA